MQHGVRLLLGAGLVGLVACAPAEPFQARFAVRGRWPGERVIGYRLETQDAVLREAVEVALAQWQETGCVRFRRAGAEAELVLGWERGEHDSCATLGVDAGVAHAGPVGPETFVHFDPERAWGRELSLSQAALHEIGHVLGLGHSPDETAVMFAEPSLARARLGSSDRAGIHSLYGGGVDSEADVVVLGKGVRLRGVAPARSTDWTLFDTDGDGDDEVVVWSTVAAGHGALWVFHFARGPELERTLGPLYGAVAPECEVGFGVAASGERWMVVEGKSGGAVVRVFDEEGGLRVFEGEVPLERGVGGVGSGEARGDLDGDGVVERVRRGG